MIGQYLAALHPASYGRIALIITAAELSDWGKDIDSRMAEALADGDAGGAGTVFAEYLLTGSARGGCAGCSGPSSVADCRPVPTTRRGTS